MPTGPGGSSDDPGSVERSASTSDPTASPACSMRLRRDTTCSITCSAAGSTSRWRSKAMRSLALRGGETVLDLCTGTADLAIASATASPGAASVVGVDFAGQMLRLGLAKLAERGLAARIRLVQGDAMRIPLASASVDAATVAFGIRNVERPETAFADVFRVLRPGGRFAILEFGVPRVPGVRQAYLAYFRHVLPRIGSVIPATRPRTRICRRRSGRFRSPRRGGIARCRRIFTREGRLFQPRRRLSIQRREASPALTCPALPDAPRPPRRGCYNRISS